MTSKRRGPRRSRQPRRAVEWFDRIIDETISSTGQQSNTLTADIASDEMTGMTLLRTIISIGANLSIAGTGGLLSMGIVQVTSDALAALALPDADIGTDKPGWLWRASRTVFTSLVNDRSQETRFDIDLRTGRRLRGSANDLILVFDLGVSSADVNIDGLVRMLFAKS